MFKTGVLRTWAQGRKRMDCLARVYCNRSSAEEALGQVAGMGNVRWWISTLDNNPHWTAEELAADLRDNWHADIAAADLWGVQYAGGMTADWDTVAAVRHLVISAACRTATPVAWARHQSSRSDRSEGPEEGQADHAQQVFAAFRTGSRLATMRPVTTKPNR